MRFLALVLALTLFGSAQAQRPANADWTKVQAIASGTRIRVSGQRPSLTCTFITADTDSLTCVRTTTVFFFPITRRLVFGKSQIASIKLSRRFLSGLAGAGIGAGAGAGIGAGLESQQGSQEDGHLLTAVCALFGGILGASIGSGTEFLAAPTVYRAP